MKINSIIIMSLNLLGYNCVPTPVVPVPDTGDGSNNQNVIIQDSSTEMQDSSENIVDSGAGNDVLLLVSDSALVVDSTNTQIDAQELDGALNICTKACINLTKLGCSEGKDSNCISVCDHLSKTKLIKYDAKCLFMAKDVKAIKACGGVSCKK